MAQSTRAATTRLSADERKAIAIQGLAKAVSISTLAVHHNVSRPLVYRQLRQASAALDDVFSPAQTDDTGEVLFMLPVTQRWLDQVILALTMVGHVSFRATIELMRDLFGVPTSLGTIHTVLQQAAQRAIAINAGIDLSPIHNRPA